MSAAAWDNNASGLNATVSSGEGNKATGENASVSGGEGGEALNHDASISGGAGFTLTALGGGMDNQAGAQARQCVRYWTTLLRTFLLSR